MKKILAALVALLVLPMVLGNDAVFTLGGTITTEEFVPEIWLCNNRVVSDDNLEWGRVSQGGDELVERLNNYAFEGEQIQWDVLVMDKNGVEKLKDVRVTAGQGVQGPNNPVEANCVINSLVTATEQLPESCNAKILEENLTTIGYDNVAALYTCTLTVEPQWYNEYWVTIEAIDLDDQAATIDENEYWFFNPLIRIGVEGTLNFVDVRPGTESYSSTILVENDADIGSGVMLDMFIAGQNFYDSSSSLAKCPTSNVLELSNFAYYVTNGAYNSAQDLQVDTAVYDPIATRAVDVEGYLNIQNGDHFDRTMYDEAEILQAGPRNGPYYLANVLAPGAEMAMTFRLDLPEPCNGNFDLGALHFYGEAI